MYPIGGGPPVHSPLRLDAAILSRTRSPITSRSNCANDSSTLRVSLPMLLGVQRVELQIQVMLGGFAGIDRAAVCLSRCVHGASPAAGLFRFLSGTRRPKNRGPFQFVPVISPAIKVRLG